MESLFIAELVKRMPLTLKEFMDKADEFVNTIPLQALINSQGINRSKQEQTSQDQEGHITLQREKSQPIHINYI